MRHYEIVILVNPERSEFITQVIEKYSNIVTNGGGKIHRLENCGRKYLAYAINKLNKAHFLLMNIEISNEVLEELKNTFKFDDLIVRQLILAKKHAITTPSPFMKNEKVVSK